MSKRNVRWLLTELPELVTRGVMGGDVAERIRQHYGSASEDSIRRLALTVCSILGAALVGAGIILVLAYNWSELSRPVRTAIALAPLAAAQALALWILATGRKTAGLREGCATFLTLAIAAAIALVAQTYNIPGDSGTFTLTWMLLALPVAYLLDATVPILVYFVGITVWAGCDSVRDAQLLFYWPLLALALPRLYTEIRRNPFSVPASVMSWVLAICLLVGAGITMVDLLDDLWIVIYSSLAALLFIGGYMRCREAPAFWQNPFLVIGGAATAVMSLVLTFESPWRHLGYSYWRMNEHRPLTLWIDTGLVALLAAAAIVMLVRLFRTRRRTPILFGLLPAVTVAGYGLRYLTGGEIPSMLLFNAYLFTLGLSTLIMGVSRNRIGTVNAGMVIITGLLVARFFDSDFGFLARGLAFIAIGVGFLATNWVLVRRAKGGAQ